MATLPPGLRHADQLVDPLDRVADIPQAERHADDAEGVVGRRQVPGVAFHEGDPPGGARLANLQATDLEHLAAEVGADDRRSTLAGAVVGQGQVGRPGAAIEDRNPRLGRHHSRREGPPGSIDVQAQQVVEQIVPSGDRGEHPPHPAVGLVNGGGTLGRVGRRRRASGARGFERTRDVHGVERKAEAIKGMPARGQPDAGPPTHNDCGQANPRSARWGDWTRSSRQSRLRIGVAFRRLLIPTAGFSVSARMRPP